MNVRSGAKYDKMNTLHQNGQPPDENDGGNRLRGLHLRRAGADDGAGRPERREVRGQDHDRLQRSLVHDGHGAGQDLEVRLDDVYLRLRRAREHHVRL